MGVDIQTYRCRIGAFHPSCCQPILVCFVHLNLTRALRTLGSVIFIGILLLMSGVEPNPGPSPTAEKKRKTEENVEEMDCTALPTVPEKQTITPLEQKLKECGLDAEYWSEILKNKLGIQSLEQLKFVGPQSIEKVKKLTRYEWEENALKSIIPVQEKDYIDYRINQTSNMQKRKQEAAEILNNLEKLKIDGRDRTDNLVQTEEMKLKNTLNIPDEAWIKHSNTHSLQNFIDRIKTEFGDLKDLAIRGKEMSPDEVIENASGGLVLRGILLTRNVKDCLELRRSVIKAPTDIKLQAPIIQQKDETTEITSKLKSDMFHRCLDTMGYSASANIQGGGWGFSAEAGFSPSHSKENENEHESHNEQIFHSRIMYSVVPTASCELKKEHLRLTTEAVEDLKKIELLKKSTKDDNLIQRKLEEFFKSYGSHINTGTIHFGGIYEWIATYSSQSSSSKSLVKSMVHDALSAFASLSYSGFGFSAGGSISGEYVKGHANVSKSYEESELARTNLRILKLGGPQEVSSLPLWKMGLISHNCTWSIIDRGSICVKDFKGIWELIVNLRSEFADPIDLSNTMKCSWEKMSGLRISDELEGEGIIRAVEKAESLLTHVSEWIKDPNLSTSCLQYLSTLTDKMNEMLENTGTHEFWICQIQTNSVLTDFLSKIIEMKSSFSEQDSSRIRYFIRKLLTPLEHKMFPHKEAIMTWVKSPLVVENFPSVITTGTFDSIDDFLNALKHNFLPQLNTFASKHENKTFERQQLIDTHMTAELAIAVRRMFKHFERKSDMHHSVFLTTLLLPLSYDKSSFGFDILVTVDNLATFIKEAELQNSQFNIYASKGIMQQQALLLDLAVKIVLAQKDIFRRETMFEKTIQPIRQILNSNLNKVINEFATSSPFDFESLLIYLEQFKLGNEDFSLVPTISLKHLDSILSEHQLQKAELKFEPTPNTTTTAAAKEILQILGLDELFPDRISMQDVMSIKREKQKGELQMTDLPWCVLKKLIMIDYRTRENDIAYFFHNVTDNSDGIEESDEFGSFDDILDDIGTTSSASTQEPINPLDIFLAIFCCCDNILKQVLVTKMFMCKLAVPFIYPLLSPEKLICSIWPMRTIYIEYTDNNQQASEISVVDHSSKRVAFLRLDRPSWSKSKLINDVLSDQAHDTFFNKDCSLGLTDRRISNGLVETTWYIPSAKNLKL